MRRRLSTCKWCAAPIRWAFTPRGQHLAIDPHPVEDGNLVLTVDNSGYMHVRAVKAGEDPAPTRLYIAHSVTCPSLVATRARDRYCRRAHRRLPPTLGAQQQQLDIPPEPDPRRPA